MRRVLLLLLITRLIVSLGAQDFRAIDSTLRELRKPGHDSVRITLYNDLCWYWSAYDFNKARKYGNKALHMAQQRKRVRLTADSYNMLAGVYDYAGKYDTAMLYYRRALDLRQQRGDSAGVAGIYNNMGISYYFRRDYARALQYYVQAARIREKIKDIQGLSQCLNNIGVIYRGMGEYKKAIQTYRRSLAVKTRLGDIDGQYRIHINLGVVYQNMHVFDSALYHANEALSLSRQINDTTFITSAYINTGAVYKDLGRYDEALEKLRQAEAILVSVENQHDRVYCMQLIAETYHHKKNFTKAKSYYLNALRIATAIQRNEVRQAILLGLSNLYAALGKHDSAFVYQSGYLALTDSLFNIENKRHQNELEARFESERKENEIARLESQRKVDRLEIHEQQLQKKFLWVVITGILLLVCIIFYALIQRGRDNRKIRQQNILISKSLSEKEVLLREIHHRVKNNLQVITGLLELQEELHQQPQTKKWVAEAQNRIRSMALIHETLYRTENIAEIDLQGYIDNLVIMIETGFSGKRTRVTREIHTDNVRFSLDTIIPLGLILNELVTNAYKYAFDENKTGHLRISLEPVQDQWLLSVCDNGNGFPEMGLAGNSFGIRLVKMLARQLKGSVEAENKNGACFYVRFTDVKNTA